MSSSPAAAWPAPAWASVGPACWPTTSIRLKAKTYRANWPQEPFHEGDVWKIEAGTAFRPRRPRLGLLTLPGLQPGRRAGGPQGRPLVGAVRFLAADRGPGRGRPRAPRPGGIENVVGLPRLARGRRLRRPGRGARLRGYRFGALEIDAQAFLPQSRPAGVRPRDSARRRRSPPLTGDSAFSNRRRARGLRRPAGSPERAHWLWWSPGAAAPLATPSSPTCCSPMIRSPGTNPIQTRRLLSLMGAAARGQGRGRQTSTVFAHPDGTSGRRRVPPHPRGGRPPPPESRGAFRRPGWVPANPLRRLLAPDPYAGRNRGARCAHPPPGPAARARA